MGEITGKILFLYIHKMFTIRIIGTGSELLPLIKDTII